MKRSNRRPALTFLFSAACFLSVVAASSAPAIAATTPAEDTALALSAGVFDTGGDDVAEAGVEVRLANRLPWGLGVIAGVSANEDEAFWGYVGARRPFALGRSSWRLVPSFAVVGYEQGDGKDLGQALEFRSGLELHYAFESRQTLGVNFYHMSNASLSEVNPGANSLVLVWAIAFGR
ncbi:MAG: acyloxyacyl hydrolase [Thermoanaerobaculia bacterium]